MCVPGTVWTATAHIITAVIGSGVLSLAWAMAQLGWVAGPLSLLLFATITFYTCGLLADCYRVGDPVTGKRNYTYTEAVQSYLGTCSSHSKLLPPEKKEHCKLKMMMCMCARRRVARLVLRLLPVRQHVRHRHRLHHHRLHQRRVSPIEAHFHSTCTAHA